MATIRADIESDIEIEVAEYYSKMSDYEKKEMFESIVKESNILDMQDDKQKFYKEFAYQVGNFDSLNLDYLIEELQYWSKK